MGCVYRYIDLEDNIIKYVGIIWSDNRTLKKRVAEHFTDAWFINKQWKIEYIEEDICTRTDAEYFESHYISLYGTDRWYNNAKVNWGISHYLPNRENDWKLYDILECCEPKFKNKSKCKYNINDLLKCENDIFRVLDVLDEEERVLVINCTKKIMPKLIPTLNVNSYALSSEEELLKTINESFIDIELLDEKRRDIMNQRYSLVSSVLPFLSDEKMRSFIIDKLSKQKNISKQSIRSYLISYLIYQDISVLAPRERKEKEELTQFEKDMKWAIDKYYDKNINSINKVHTLMLRKKYMDESGKLLSEYPSINQLRYFYKKNYK